jgi:CBS domain-containing protein
MIALHVVPDLLATPRPLTVDAASTVRDAAQVMAREHAPAVAVVDGSGRVCGLVTEATVVRLIALGGDPATTSVTQAMLPDPDVLTAEDSVLDAFEIMHIRGMRCLPVLGDGQVIGIVSEGNLLDVARREILASLDRDQAQIFTGCTDGR